MVNEELQPFSLLLLSNLQGDSTVMFVLSQEKPVCGVHSRNYVVSLFTCCNAGFPAFQQPTCQN